MDTYKLIKELHKENLCTYFVLPLLKLNKSSFVSESNFIDSYLTRDGHYIFVKVAEILFIELRIMMHPLYKAAWMDSTGQHYIQYHIPRRWEEDIKSFLDGKYSKISTGAKEMIHEYSGLQYRVRRETDQVPITDVRLLALDKSIAVKELWEEYYGTNIHDDQELLSIPDDKTFIDVSILTKYEPEEYDTRNQQYFLPF